MSILRWHWLKQIAYMTAKNKPAVNLYESSTFRGDSLSDLQTIDVDYLQGVDQKFVFLAELLKRPHRNS